MAEDAPSRSSRTGFQSRAWKSALLRWSRRLGVVLLLLVVGAWFGLRCVPIPPGLLQPPVQSTGFLDRNGVPLRQTPAQEQYARNLTYADIPPTLRTAFLAAEDKRFFQHHGVDLLAVGRAAYANLREGRTVSGASTITQQLIKTAVPRPRSYQAKLIEIVTAVRLEQLWTKEQIFTAYLNRLDFGNLNRGVAAAADYYFGKPLADLSEAECAFLAGLPLNPARLNPRHNFAGATRRQQVVLRRMQANGGLSAEQHARATAEPLHLQPAARIFHAPHFVDAVLQRLQEEPRTLHRTTLDLSLNQFIENSVQQQLMKLDGHHVQNAAVVVIDNATGGVLGLVGSENYFAPGAGQYNGALAARSAGSTLKPFVYLLALERGDTPATIVADVPTEFPTVDGPYRPSNYDRHCQGPVRYRSALACSLNIPAVKVLESLGGAGPLQRQLQSWGITSFTKEPVHYGPGLAIGNAEVRLLELANAYAALARLGEWRPYQFLLDEDTRTTSPVTARLVSRDSCWLIADLLSDNAARSPAFGTGSALHFTFPVACKTGTSTDFRDNWAMGYTPEFTVGVWVGNFDGSAMQEVSGVTGAAPVMHDVMEYLHRRFGTSWYERPASIVEQRIDPLTGKILASVRRGMVTEKFTAHHLPPAESAQDYDELGRVLLGAEYAAWAQSPDNQIISQVVTTNTSERLHLVSPQPGSIFLIDPDVPTTEFVPLVVNGGEHMQWECPTLQFQQREGRAFAVAVEGEHRLTAVDPGTGQTVATWFRVKAL